MSYAQNTSVPVAKSRAEIEDLVARHGATRFASLAEDGRSLVMFEAQGRRVVFELPLPSATAEEFWRTPGGRRRRSPSDAQRQWEQACRQRWRALLLVIKAKLEAVEAGITDFESEFLAHIQLPNGKTVGQWIQPQLAASYDSGKMPPMLPAGRA